VVRKGDGISIPDFAEKCIEAYVEAFRTGNCDALEKLEDIDMVHHSIARGQDTIVGWAAHKQVIANIQKAITDFMKIFPGYGFCRCGRFGNARVFCFEHRL